MRLLFVFLFLQIYSVCFAQPDTIKVNGISCVIQQTPTQNPPGEGIVKEFILVSLSDGYPKDTLTHILHEEWHDCNSIVLQLGHVDIERSSIVLYSYWARTGDAPASPCGVRKQTYIVGANGSLIQTSGFVYLKEYGYITTADGNIVSYDDDNSVSQFQEYFEGTILSDEGERTALFNSVRNQLGNLLEEHVNHWSKPSHGWADNPFGYCR